MIPFSKIFTLVIRQFSKPMLNYMKSKHKQRKMVYFNRFFIFFGQKYNRMEHIINLRILKTTKSKHLKQLGEDAALEKGIEGFYEVMVYGIILGSLKSQASAKKLEDRLQRIQKALQIQIQQVKKSNIKVKDKNNDKDKSLQETI